MNREDIKQETVDRVMERLSPEARFALHTLSEMQKRPPEDVVRDEIKNYIEGKLPAIDIDAIMRSLKDTAYRAGYIIGSVRNFARRWNNED